MQEIRLSRLIESEQALRNLPMATLDELLEQHPYAQILYVLKLKKLILEDRDETAWLEKASIHSADRKFLFEQLAKIKQKTSSIQNGEKTDISDVDEKADPPSPVPDKADQPAAEEEQSTETELAIDLEGEGSINPIKGKDLEIRFEETGHPELQTERTKKLDERKSGGFKKGSTDKGGKPEHLPVEPESEFLRWLKSFSGPGSMRQESSNKDQPKEEKSRKAAEKENEAPRKNRKGKGKKKKKAGKNRKKKLKTLVENSQQLDEDIVSEALADLLAQQGHLKKAERMYEHLMLKKPKKSAYFAGKLSELAKTEEEE